MKSPSLILTFSALQGFSQNVNDTNLVRQIQQGSGVVGDTRNVAANGTAPAVMQHETGGSLFQLWTINQTKGTDHLLDQKLVGAYLPKADVKITSLDPYTKTRTRVDPPFTVEITVSGLLSGAGIPAAATKVLLEQHIQRYAAGQTSLDPNSVAANTPHSTAFITRNDKTTLTISTSSLTAENPLKASGEEHFIIHALADGTYTIALMSDTIFDNRLLCDPVTFKITRSISVNAMQTYYSEGSSE